MENGAFEGISMPEGIRTQEKPERGRAMQEESDKAQEDPDFAGEPMAGMEGEMSQMGAGQTIPAGNQKGTRKKYTREFREVPKTREELRRRQQNRREQKPTDGSSFA